MAAKQAMQLDARRKRLRMLPGVAGGGHQIGAWRVGEEFLSFQRRACKYNP